MLVFLFSGGAAAQDLLYTDAQADCAARIIFMNECSGRDENLLYWSPDEPFPSLGIGHFIWYPERGWAPFRESFPRFLAFAKEDLGLSLPAWIEALPDRRAPWRTREEFMAEIGSGRMWELHDFLRRTKREQAHFIIRRFQKIFPAILDDADEADRKPLREKYELLMRRPAWVFAMIDYVNFKGEGLNADARYEGKGWGLAQVLLEMKIPDDPDGTLDEFIAAAERVLEARVRRSPRPEVEAKWLPGWRNRLARYRTISCS